MKLIAKRHIDLYAPGSEIPAGRYSEATLRGLLTKGHVIVVDEEPTAAAELSPEQAAATARREEAVKAFAKPTADGRPLTADGDLSGTGQLPTPVGLVIERVPEAESDTVTRIAEVELELEQPVTVAKPAGKKTTPKQ